MFTVAGKIFRRIEVSILYILGKFRGLFTSSRYAIKRGYRHRKKSVYFDDTSLTNEYQKEVYQLARFYLDDYGYNEVVDLGCGSGFKLMQYFSDGITVGIDVSPTYEFLTNKYPDRQWINAADTKNFPATSDIIICADVIEHVLDPDKLITSIKKMDFKLLFISTPERSLARGWYDYGPPDNTSHVREWNAKEFRKYMAAHFEIISHQITNIEDATQLVICRKTT